MMYDELIKELRELASLPEYCENIANCDKCPKEEICLSFTNERITEIAEAIDELLRVAKAMHTWIFRNSGDEQAVYDECGLTDEMNAELGYCGQFIVEPSKEKEE